MKGILNILVTVDFGDKDKAVLAEALLVAEKFKAKAWILHIAMPDPDFVGYDVGPQYIRDIRAKDLRKEHKTLKKYADNFVKSGVKAEGLLVQGPTIETILDEAKKLKIDLIVTGVHKHGFWFRLLNENTPAELAAQSKTPLLLVP